MSDHRDPEHRRAHQQAKQRDARSLYDVGDELTVVLDEDPQMNNGREGVARVNGLVVFVYPGQIPVEPGATLDVVVSETQDDFIRGVAVRRRDLA